MARTKITRLCALCGDSFTPWTGNAGKYCSTTCYHSDKSAAIGRFWTKVDKSLGLGPEGTCWEWKGKLTSKGYGKSGLGPAHRVSWEITNGATNLWVLHRCDNPPCVNPAHLFLGDNADNMRDMVNKGRSPWGSRHPNAILSESDVRQIRAEYKPKVITHNLLAAQYGVSKSTIGAIISRKLWPHL